MAIYCINFVAELTQQTLNVIRIMIEQTLKTDEFKLILIGFIVLEDFTSY